MLKELLLLLEQPQIVDPEDFGMKNGATNKNLYDYLMKKNAQLLFIHNGLKVYHWKSFYFATNDSKTTPISYFIKTKHSFLNAVGEMAITQKSLWSDRSILAYDLAKIVFWDHLFKKTHLVMSDSFQTEYGQHFWIRRVKEAFDKNLNVYILKDNDKRYLEKLDSIVDFNANQHKIWGSNNSFQQHKLIITDKRLMPTRKDIDYID